MTQSTTAAPAESKSPFRLYAFLASSTLLSLSEPCLRFGVSWYLLGATGSAALFATLFGLTLLADVLAKPLLAPLADQFDRLRVYRLASATAVLLSLLLAAYVALGPFNAVVIGAALVGLGLVSSLREPAAAALLAELSDPTRLARAQAFQTSANAVTTLAGPALAGVLVAGLGSTYALAGSAALELAGLLGVLLVLGRGVTKSASAHARWNGFHRVWQQRISDGLRCLWRTKAERNVVLAAMFINTGVVSFVTIVIPVWVARDMHGSATQMALLEGCFGAGMLFGSAVLLGRLNSWFGKALATRVGLALGTFGFIGLVFWPQPPTQLLWVALISSGMCVASINTGTVRMLATPDHYRSRMAGATSFVVSGLLPLAVPLYGQLLQRASAETAIQVCAAFFATGSLMLALNRKTQGLLCESSDDIVGRYKTMYPAAYPDRVHNS